MLGEVGRTLLRRPGRREQLAPGPGGDQPGGRHHDQRDDREHRRQPQHRDQRDGEEHQHARCQGHQRQQALHQRQIGDGAGDDLPGAQAVLLGAVEFLYRAEYRIAQVMLHVQGQPAAEITAYERRCELQQRHPGQGGDQPTQPLGDPGHGVVDREPGEQRGGCLGADADAGRE